MCVCRGCDATLLEVSGNLCVCFVFIVSKFSKRLELVDFCLLLLVVQVEMGVYKKKSLSLPLSLSHTHTHTHTHNNGSNFEMYQSFALPLSLPEVWLGEYKGAKVAIKMLKDIKDSRGTKQFLAEASVMT